MNRISNIAVSALFFTAVAAPFADCATHRRDEIKRRDPFVTVVPQENCYYLVAPEWKDGHGWLYLYKSTDLDTWTDVGFGYKSPEQFLGTSDWWAPDTYEYKGKYYCFVTVSNPEKGILRGTTVLKADNITGPYQSVLPYSRMAMTPEGVQCLDASLYVDTNGVPWMFYAVEWNGPNVKNRDGEVWVQRLNDDLSGTVGEPHYLFKASEGPWVKQHAGGYITDAPFVMRDPASGNLIMTWSSFAPDYAIGQVISKSGNVLGPWEHVETPLLTGGGHAMVFEDLDGNLKMSFHAPNEADATFTIKDVIIRDGKLEMKPQR